MTQKLNPFSGRQFLDANGDPYSGAKLFTYLEGTSTKQTVTKDEAGLSNHTNPIILNSKGEPADAGGSAQAIWQPDGTAIKLVLAPSTDTDPPVSAIASWDNLEGINDTVGSGGSSEWVEGSTPTYVNATSFTLVGDQSSTYHIGRRIKTTNSGGTVYSIITAVAYTTLTTVTVENDSGSLDSGLSAVYYSLLSADYPSVPGDLIQIRILSDEPPTTAGTATAYTATLQLSALYTDRFYRVQIHTDNTGACTMAFDSIAAKNIKLIDGTDPYAGALITGMIAYFVYDGTNLVLMNPDITAALLGANGGIIDTSALDTVSLSDLTNILWTNNDHATDISSGSFATQNTFYLFIPAYASTLNYKVDANATSSTCYFRLTYSGANGSTITIAGGADGWDAENGTLDVSAASGLTLINVQGYRSGAGAYYINQVHGYFS